MEIEIGKRYKLYAPWHPNNGQMVEVIQKRDGISPAYRDKQIFHIATDPGDTEKRVEDLDSEFVESHFRDPKEKMTEAPLEEYLDERGLSNAATLKEHGIDVSLFRDENGDHYLEIKHDGKTDLIKVEDYEGLEDEREDVDFDGGQVPESGEYHEGPPNPMSHLSEDEEDDDFSPEEID